MKYIIVTFMVEREGEYFVSRCLELGTASFGRDRDEALENLADATDVYLNTLAELGEVRGVLREKGVRVYSYEPAVMDLRRRLPGRVPTDSILSPRVLELETVAA